MGYNFNFEDFFKRMFALLVGLVLCALVGQLLGGCATRKPTVTGNVSNRADTAYRAYVVRDTLLVRDSVAVDVFRAGDTVFKTKEVWRWRDKVRWRTDTIYKSVMRSDTVRVPVPVERRLSWWERNITQPLHDAVGAGVGLIGLIWVVLWIVRRKTIGRTRDER